MLEHLVSVTQHAQAMLVVGLAPSMWGVDRMAGIDLAVARQGIEALPARVQKTLASAPQVVLCAANDDAGVAVPLRVADSIARSFEISGLCYPIADGPATSALSRALAAGGICSVERHDGGARLVGVPGELRVRAVAMQLLRSAMLACRGAVFHEEAATMQRHVQAWLTDLSSGAEPLLREGRCKIERAEVPLGRRMHSWVLIDLAVEVSRWPGARVAVAARALVVVGPLYLVPSS